MDPGTMSAKTCPLLPDQPPITVIRTPYSIADALTVTILDERRLEHLDLAPTTALRADELEKAYDAFYGISPLSSPSSSPPSSRPSTPITVPQSSSSIPPIDDRNRPPASLSLNVPVLQSNRSGNSAKRRQKEKKKQKRQAARRDAEKKKPVTSYTPRPSVVEKYLSNSKPIAVDYSADDIPSGSTGYMALPDRKSGVYDVEHLVKKKGFRLVEWDGRTAIPIVDVDERVVAVLVGRPNDPEWDGVISSAYDALTEASSRMHFDPKIKKHRRGKFPALNFGISYGGGQQEPGNLTYREPGYDDELQTLTAHPAFVRIAGFQSASFATWAPKLYAYYREHDDALREHHPNLRKNFPNSIWAAAAFNFGPRTVTAKHRDYANIPFGWCSVTALGKFNSKLSAHMVFWELKLVVEFPSGSTIDLPSAAISHSNTPIRKGEMRASFTQYTAGGLIRWCDHGFQNDEKFFKDMDDAERDAIAEENERRAKLGTSLFSTVDELIERYDDLHLPGCA